MSAAPDARRRATVFGAAGFVGRHLVAHLEAEGCSVRAIRRGDESWRGAELGDVFYCIGLTANFRQRPFETVEAHVGMLAEVLRQAKFDSLVYLSSTRVYSAAASTREEAPIPVEPSDPSDLYDISKLMGEALCLSRPEPTVRVARLSNVFGDDMGPTNFLGSLIRDAVVDGRIVLGQDLGSEKDYVAVDYVARALAAIAERGTERLYNVARGRNTSHAAIVETLAKTLMLRVEVLPRSPIVRFAPIVTERLAALLPEDSIDPLDRLAVLIAKTRDMTERDSKP